jgi:hypothetical protein
VAQRWQSAPCEQPRRVACQTPPTRWQLTAEPHTFLEAPEACRKDFGNEYQFALPRNWQQNQALQNLIPAGTSVWIHLQTGT